VLCATALLATRHCTQVVRVEEPSKRKGGVMVGSVKELVDRLRNEAKVI
jgi:electron transfer flavoprotein beta subunit